MLADALGLAPVHDAPAGVVGVHPAVAQIDEDRDGRRRAVLHQDGGLLELLGERVAVVGVAGKGTGTHDQVALERAGNAHLHAELVGLAGANPKLMHSTSGACQL